MERQAPGPIASSSRSGLVRLRRPRELNRPTNLAGCESVKGLEQLLLQEVLEQPDVAHFAGVGSGDGVRRSGADGRGGVRRSGADGRGGARQRGAAHQLQSDNRSE